MADPLSIAVGITSLIGVSLKLSHGLKDVCAKFQRAPQTISSLYRECSNTSTGLVTLNRLLQSRANVLVSAQESNQDFLACFDLTIVNMAQTFSVLDDQFHKLSGGDDSLGKLSLRMRFMWIDGELNTLMQELRDQRSALVFLIECIQL